MAKLKVSDESLDTAMYVAGYTLRALKSNISVFWSWGAEKRGVFDIDDDGDVKIALGLKVNGFRHQGWIYVALNEGTDLYDIYLPKDGETDEVEMVKYDLYVDQICMAVDDIVERSISESDETYEDKVRRFYNLL